MPAPDLQQPHRHLTLLDAACVIVGIIIGSGIYETTPLIASSAGHPLPLAIIWIMGVIALAGALCYAELATAFPHAGGDYLFLRRAYGPLTGFLFGWFDLWIMRPANIGAMAVVFARYFHQLVPGGYATPPLHYALGVVLVLWSFTLLGARPGAWLQNTLTLAKCAGLLCVASAGFYCALWLPAPAATAADAPILQWSWEGQSLAFVLVMFSYGGWNDVSFLAGEIKEPQKNMLRSLVLGVGCVALIYLTVNYAFYAALGWHGLTSSEGGAAADVARRGRPVGRPRRQRADLRVVRRRDQRHDVRRVADVLRSGATSLHVRLAGTMEPPHTFAAASAVAAGRRGDGNAGLVMVRVARSLHQSGCDGRAVLLGLLDLVGPVVDSPAVCSA